MLDRPRRSCPALAAALLALYACRAWAAVVIHEVHYHPPSPGGKTLEFLELANTSAADADVSGWSFREGIRFTFPAGAVVPAGGFVIVCRDREALAAHFGLAGDLVFGNYEGVLDNGGDEVVLVDALNAFVDRVAYDDRVPWPEVADGDGASLSRLCSDAPGFEPRSWSGAFMPSPLAENGPRECPLPPRETPAIVFTEIHYHSFELRGIDVVDDRDTREEFVELHNPGAETVAMERWRLEGAIDFVFPSGTAIPPGGYLAVCRDPGFVRETFGVADAIGPFEGQLSNRQERLLLRDSSRRVVDHIRYRDDGGWPLPPDGDGRSLEKVVPAAPSDDSASWSSSAPVADRFVTRVVIGFVQRLLIQRVALGINGRGEYIVDDVLLERVDEPGANLVANGGFEAGTEGWSARGAAAGSEVVPGAGAGGTDGLRLVSTGACGEGCGSCASADSVAFTLPSRLDDSAVYRLSVTFRYVSGSANFFCRVLGGPAICQEELLASPGSANGSAAPTLAPFVSEWGRFPAEPRSDDEPWISVHVRSPSGDPIDAVELTWFAGQANGALPMHDDGEHGDGGAGDGVYGARMERFPHDTAVLFRIEARSTGGLAGGAPERLFLERESPADRWGYYVNDEPVDSLLPVYHVLMPEVDEENPVHINEVITECSDGDLLPASFAFRGEVYPSIGVRFRGNTACVLEKRNLKFRFNDGRLFRGARKINLQGLWTDKSLIREHLGWDFVRQMGVPYCETEFVRVHLNGRYHGLFLCLEHPDERFLRRNGLDGMECLYKARQPPNNDFEPGVSFHEDPSEYPLYWERETCENEDFSALAGFIDELHADSRGSTGPTAEFFLLRTLPEWLIAFQTIQVSLNNVDSTAKNHFLYRERGTDRWALLSWDLDLIFGKRFDGALHARRPPVVGTLNDCMLEPLGHLSPWFMTAGSTPCDPLAILCNNFINSFLNAHESFRRAYLLRLWQVLEEKLRSDVYDPRIDELEAFLAEEELEDRARWGRFPATCLPGCRDCVQALDMHSNLQIVKEQIAMRHAFLRELLESEYPEIFRSPRLQVTEILYNPLGPGEDLEFVEILNASSRDVDISGWALAGAVQLLFPAGTVIPAGGIAVATGSRQAFLARYPDLPASVQVLGDWSGRLANEGEEVRLIDSNPVYPATMDSVRYADGGAWPEMRDGHSIELTGASATRDNGEGESWTLSDAPLGTPGRIRGEARTFVRGDVDEDGTTTLTDAVVVLLYLFAGGEEPSCEDAGDADDDGDLLLTDAVYVLSYLFQGGAPPAPPHPERGVDPTADALACK